MSELDRAIAEPSAPAAATLSFEATDVTGTHSVDVSDVQHSLPAGAAAQSLASMMGLPRNVPWALRNDSTSAFLQDEKPIGDQVKPGDKVTVIPKTHLG